MPGAGCCPERAPSARGLCSPCARRGPGPREVPGGGAGSGSQRASEPGSRRPTFPASSAQLGALAPCPPPCAPRPPPFLKGQCCLCARTRAGAGGGTSARSSWSQVPAGEPDRRPFYSSQKAGIFPSGPLSLPFLLLRSGFEPQRDPPQREEQGEIKTPPSPTWWWVGILRQRGQEGGPGDPINLSWAKKIEN